MARYFFHVQNERLVLDEHGTEFSSALEARDAAARFAGDLLREAPGQIFGQGHLAVAMADESGQVLFSVLVLGNEAPAAEDLLRAARPRRHANCHQT
jgi:hypothetical protein